MIRLLAPLILAFILAGCARLPTSYVLPQAGWGGDSTRVALKPGDIIIVSSWVNGNDATAGGSSYPPLATTETIALRKVRPGKSLAPAEAALLGAILSVNAPDRTKPEFQGAVKDNEAEIWNAVVSALEFKKGSQDERPYLGVNAAKARESLAKASLPAEFLFGESSHEARCIDPVSTGLLPVVSGPNLNCTSFYNGQVTAAGRAEVIRKGASMHRAQAGEDRWTLREWEFSNICGDANTIVELTLRGSVSYFVRDKGSFHIRWTTDQDGQAQRRINSKRDPGAALFSFDRGSLDWVTPRDVERLRWKTPVPDHMKQACLEG